MDSMIGFAEPRVDVLWLGMPGYRIIFFMDWLLLKYIYHEFG